MKHFLFALSLLLPLSASALEVSDVQLVRMLNGHSFQCKASYEVGRDSYFPELASASVTDEAASFRLDLKFYRCEGDKTEQHWGTRRPLDPAFFTDSDGNPVRVEFRTPEFVFGLEGAQNAEVVAVPNEAEQTLGFQFPLAANLTPVQKADLVAGKPVRVRTQLLYRAIGTAYTVREELPLGYQFGAAYTVFFTLKK